MGGGTSGGSGGVVVGGGGDIVNGTALFASASGAHATGATRCGVGVTLALRVFAAGGGGGGAVPAAANGSA